MGAETPGFTRMRSEDLDEVVGLEQRSFSAPWTRALFEGELQNADLSFFLVARLQAELIGYAGYWLVRDEAHIVNLAVKPEVRRQGIARRLLTALLAHAVGRGALRATLEVRAGNTAAQSLYGSLGFKLIAIRKQYYQDTGEDAWIYWHDELVNWVPQRPRSRSSEE